MLHVRLCLQLFVFVCFFVCLCLHVKGKSMFSNEIFFDVGSIYKVRR